MSKIQPKALWIGLAAAAVATPLSVALHWPLHSIWDGLAAVALPVIAGNAGYVLARDNREPTA